MKTSIYLFYNGKCQEAFKYYEQLLGAKIVAMLTNADTPMASECPAERLGNIVHARITIGDAVIMGSDAPPDRYHEQAGFTVTLNVETSEEAERIFAGLSDGGHAFMPMEETFFAHRFGMCNDRFGIPWMVLHEKPMGA